MRKRLELVGEKVGALPRRQQSQITPGADQEINPTGQ
jgi:hypothetical protein